MSEEEKWLRKFLDGIEEKDPGAKCLFVWNGACVSNVPREDLVNVLRNMANRLESQN